MKFLPRIYLVLFCIVATLQGQSLHESFSALMRQSSNESIMSFINRYGGTPIVERDTVLFMARVQEALRPFVTGDFNQWDSTKGYMLPITGTDWYYRFEYISTDARVEYSIRYHRDLELIDSLNPNRVLSFDVLTSELRMPDFRMKGITRPETYALKGTIESDSVYSRSFNQNRFIQIYTPPNVARTQALPVIFFHDGYTYVYRMHVHRILDSMITSGQLPPLIGVFVTPQQRGKEYSGNPQHRNWIVSEVIPMLEKRYRTSGYAVMGSSRGALAAADIAMHHPTVIKRCLLISPAFRPTPLIDLWIKMQPALERVVIIESQYDSDWRDDARLLKTILDQQQSPYHYMVIPQGHNQEAWGTVMNKALIQLIR